jgi:class 3 adenylate cyclase
LFLVGGILVVSGSALYLKFAYAHERDKLSIKIATASVRLSRATIPIAAAGDLNAVRPILSAFAGTPEVTCVIFKIKKRDLIDYWPNAQCISENPGLFLHKQPVRQGVRVLGEANIYFTDKIIHEELRERVTIFASSVAVLLLALLISTLTAQHFLVIRPIGTIIQGLNKLRQGISDHRIDKLKAAPEIEMIARNFDQMAEDLEEQSDKLAQKNQQLQSEKTKLERIMLNTLPKATIDEITLKGNVVPTQFDDVGLLFLDFVGFTKISSGLETAFLFNELNELFTGFDYIVNHYDGERIKTIGDAYFAVTGANQACDNTAESIANIAASIVSFVAYRNQKTDIQWHCRVGVHYGSVVGGVVGKTKFIYDLFGDAVNVCSRLESHSEAMRINSSTALCERLSTQFDIESRGEIEAKGKGSLAMSFLARKQSDNDVDYDAVYSHSKEKMNILG